MHPLPKIITRIPEFSITRDTLSKRIEYSRTTVRATWNDATASALRNWHKKAGAPASALTSLNTLLLEESCCSVTGQQSGLLANPLLSICKCITNEIIAERISLLSGCPVVPVFWLQTEDHDLSEISSFGFLSNEFEYLSYESLKDQKTADSNRISTGALVPDDSLTSEIITFIKTACKAESLPEVETMISSCIKSNTTYAEAFSRCMYALYPQLKTVFLDPRMDCFDKTKSELMHRVFKDWRSLNSDLREASVALDSNNKPAPVHIRDNSPLFFYHPEGKDKNRYRIEYTENGFRIPELSSEYSLKEIEQQILHEPSRFSTSALLRPILQDMILPSVSFVAGPAEMSYLEQIRPLYARLDIPAPERIPRAHALVMDDKLFSQIEAFLPSPDLLFEPEVKKVSDTLKDEILKYHVQGKDIFTSLHPLLGDISSLLTEHSKNIDLTLQKPLQKTIESIESNIRKFLEKYDQAVLRKDSVTTSRLSKLLSVTHPGGNCQERVISPIWLSSRYGNQVFEVLYSAIRETIDTFDI
jgi:bacillithiol synthase